MTAELKPVRHDPSRAAGHAREREVNASPSAPLSSAGRASLRVLVIAPQPFYEDRGTPIAVRQVLQALTQLGHRVDLLTFPVGEPIEMAGVRILRVRNPLRFRHVPVGLSMRKVVLDVAMVMRLRMLLRVERYDCIHAVEESAFPAAWLGRRLGIPVIYDMQSSIPEQLASRFPFSLSPVQWWLRRCERWLLRQADLVVASAGLAPRVEAVAPGARGREWQYSSDVQDPNGQDVQELRRSLGLPDGARLVVYIGNFEPYQGLAMLVSAMPLIQREIPDATFVLVGARSREPLVATPEVARLVRNGTLRIVQRQERARMPLFLAMADVLVSPRLHGANLPLKVFDYLAAGKPIVATDIPTHRRILGDGLAKLVKPTPPELSAGIVAVLRDPQQAAALSAAASTHARERLGWLPFVESVHDLLEDVRDLSARRDGLP